MLINHILDFLTPLGRREEGKDNGYKGNNVGQRMVPMEAFLNFFLELTLFSKQICDSFVNTPETFNTPKVSYFCSAWIKTLKTYC